MLFFSVTIPSKEPDAKGDLKMKTNAAAMATSKNGRKFKLKIDALT